MSRVIHDAHAGRANAKMYFIVYTYYRVRLWFLLPFREPGPRTCMVLAFFQAARSGAQLPPAWRSLLGGLHGLPAPRVGHGFLVVPSHPVP